MFKKSPTRKSTFLNSLLGFDGSSAQQRLNESRQALMLQFPADTKPQAGRVKRHN